MWHTPEAQSGERSGAVARKEAKGAHAVSLHHQVEALWPAAKATQAGSLNRSKSGGPPQDLAVTAQIWQTPSVADVLGGHLTRGGRRSGEALLKGQVKIWSAPRANERNQKNSRDSHQALSRQVQETEPHGRKSSQSPRRLNPLFVEWLMGLPIAWTDCGSVVTASCPYVRRMRSALCWLIS